MFMKQMTRLATFTAALTFFAHAAFAVPTLQLDILGGVYDTTTETIVATSDTFTLLAILTPSGGDDINTLLNDTYYISSAITPAGRPGYGPRQLRLRRHDRRRHRRHGLRHASSRGQPVPGSGRPLRPTASSRRTSPRPASSSTRTMMTTTYNSAGRRRAGSIPAGRARITSLSRSTSRTCRPTTPCTSTSTTRRRRTAGTSTRMISRRSPTTPRADPAVVPGPGPGPGPGIPEPNTLVLFGVGILALRAAQAPPRTLS